jgi:hypothetical protein
MIADGLNWLCQELVPSLVYRMTPVANASGSPSSQAADADKELAGNIRRYQFLCQLRQRESRWKRIVTRGIDAGATPWQLRGCYLAATGADAAREQAFVAGIFPPLLALQNAVSWTSAALREDRNNRLWTILGYAGLTLFLAATLLLLILC